MSEPHNPTPLDGAAPVPAKRKSAGAVLMILIGIVLMLPGLCSLFFVTSFVITEPQNLFNFSDPIQNALWILWGICFALAIGGGLLLRAGWRR
jgi:hypothetical protein